MLNVNITLQIGVSLIMILITRYTRIYASDNRDNKKNKETEIREIEKKKIATLRPILHIYTWFRSLSFSSLYYCSAS